MKPTKNERRKNSPGGQRIGPERKVMMIVTVVDHSYPTQVTPLDPTAHEEQIMTPNFTAIPSLPFPSFLHSFIPSFLPSLPHSLSHDPRIPVPPCSPSSPLCIPDPNQTIRLCMKGTASSGASHLRQHHRLHTDGKKLAHITIKRRSS